MKKYILLSTLFLVAASYANALPEDSQDGLSPYDGILYDETAHDGLKLSVELTYLNALTKDAKVDGNKIHQGGLSFILGDIPLATPSEKLNITAFGLLGFYGGSKEIDTYVGTNHSKETDTKVNTRLAMGVRADFYLTEAISLYGRAHIGIDYFSYRGELDVNGWEVLDKTESAVGLAYGIGLGMQCHINARHAISFGSDYLGSTARPEFKVNGNTIKIKAQDYVTFSAAYTYTF